MAPPPSIIAGFLTEDDRAFLLDLWVQVRERATGNPRGYSHLWLEVSEYPSVLLNKALTALSYQEGVIDSFFLHHRDGAGTSAHVDIGRRKRLNTVVIAPSAGGTFYVEGRPSILSEGDAIIFFPRQMHRLDPVVGERLVWSVGIRK